MFAPIGDIIKGSTIPSISITIEIKQHIPDSSFFMDNHLSYVLCICQYGKTSNNKTENIFADAYKSISLLLLPPMLFHYGLIDIITLFRINERKSSPGVPTSWVTYLSLTKRFAIRSFSFDLYNNTIRIIENGGSIQNAIE